MKSAKVAQSDNILNPNYFPRKVVVSESASVVISRPSTLKVVLRHPAGVVPPKWRVLHFTGLKFRASRCAVSVAASRRC